MTGEFEIYKDKVKWTVGIVLAENDYAVKNVFRYNDKDRMIPTSNDRQFDEIVAEFKSQYHDEIVRRFYGKT